MAEQIQKLAKEVKKNGYLYTMIDRTKNAAIYKQTPDKDPDDTSTAYEVFQITITKAYSLTAKPTKTKKTDLHVYNYPASEKFPGNEDFGKTAWAYNTLASAMKKFVEIK